MIRRSFSHLKYHIRFIIINVAERWWHMQPARLRPPPQAALMPSPRRSEATPPCRLHSDEEATSHADPTAQQQQRKADRPSLRRRCRLRHRPAARNWSSAQAGGRRHCCCPRHRAPRHRCCRPPQVLQTRQPFAPRGLREVRQGGPRPPR